MTTASTTLGTEDVRVQARAVSQHLKARSPIIDKHTPGRVAHRVGLFLWDMSKWPQTDVEAVSQFMECFAAIGDHICELDHEAETLPNFELNLFLNDVKPILDQSRPFLHHAPRERPKLFNEPAQEDIDRIENFNSRLEKLLDNFIVDKDDALSSTVASPLGSPERVVPVSPVRTTSSSSSRHHTSRQSIATSATTSSPPTNSTPERNSAAAPSPLRDIRSGHNNAQTLPHVALTSLPPHYDDVDSLGALNARIEHFLRRGSADDNASLTALRSPALRVEVVRTDARPVASGGFGDVWRGTRTGDETLVAIKTFRRNIKADTVRKILSEIWVWSQLKHPNILPFGGVYWAESALLPDLIAPWRENGNLSQYLERHPNAHRIKLIGGIASGLAYMHTHGLIHDDLKPANILVDDDRIPQIADFGLSAFEEEIREGPATATDYHLPGTLCYMSPERLDPARFNRRARDSRTKQGDVYSFGMIIFEAFSGDRPFPEAKYGTVFAVRDAILNGDRPKHPGKAAIDKGLSWDLWQFVTQCWKPICKSRPSLDDLHTILEQSLKATKSPD